MGVYKMSGLSILARLNIINYLYLLKIRKFIKKNEKYNKIFTHLTEEEKYWLYKIAKSLKKNSVLVEIGSYLGASACFTAKAIEGKNSKLYCVDTWKNDAMNEDRRDTYEEFKNNTADFKYIVCLRGKSDKIANNFHKKIDFIFFDGDHSYKGIKTDVDSWLPKCKKNAFLLFHDISWAKGVNKVINQKINPVSKKIKKLKNLYICRLLN